MTHSNVFFHEKTNGTHFWPVRTAQ